MAEGTTEYDGRYCSPYLAGMYPNCDKCQSLAKLWKEPKWELKINWNEISPGFKGLESGCP